MTRGAIVPAARPVPVATYLPVFALLITELFGPVSGERAFFVRWREAADKWQRDRESDRSYPMDHEKDVATNSGNPGADKKTDVNARRARRVSTSVSSDDLR